MALKGTFDSVLVNEIWAYMLPLTERNTTWRSRGTVCYIVELWFEMHKGTGSTSKRHSIGSRAFVR
jgi:hypothetical protein